MRLHDWNERALRRFACKLALACLLILVVGHGIHDALHDDEGGVAVCIALTLGLIAVRFVPPTLTEPLAVVAVVALPRVSLPSPTIERRPRGSPTPGRFPLRT